MNFRSLIRYFKRPTSLKLLRTPIFLCVQNYTKLYFVYAISSSLSILFQDCYTQINVYRVHGVLIIHVCDGCQCHDVPVTK